MPLFVHVVWFATAPLSVEQPHFPVSDGFMGERETTLKKHFSSIAQAQFVTESPNDCEQNQYLWGIQDN
jgi:hypothetical protein